MTININFSKDSNETSTIHTITNNIETIIVNETAEIIRELLLIRIRRQNERK